IQWGAEQSVPLNHPDFHGKTRQLATRIGPTGLVRSIQAVLDCRAALDANVKPRFALAAMVATTLAQTTPHQAVPS
ncbi:MAG: DNA polymerase III subunit delta', partial [Mycobacterium sp.]|nr:DNA polymerase III subunit delta' [Mycobacterium sp.]